MYFVAPPVQQILVLVPRFDREFVMTFQRHGKNGGSFEFKFVYNETTENELLLPFWHMVREVSVILSFKRILARFSNCSPQMTGQITFKLDLYIAARGPAAER